MPRSTTTKLINRPSLSFPCEKPRRVDFELDTSSESIDESLNKTKPLLEKLSHINERML